MAQGIEVHARVIRQIYNNGDYYIFALIPTEKNDSIKLNSYGNFTVTGELGYLSMNKEYDFILKEGQTNQYGTSYSVIDVPSMKLEDLKKLSYEDKYEILKECTSSDKIAKNILEAYPDYIEIAVNQGADAIDTKKIYGVGKVYNNSYCRKLISKYKYYTFCRNTKMKDYEFSVSEAKALFDKYGTAEDIIKAMSANPYYNLIEICKRSFDNADELLREVRKDLIDSDIRTEALIMEILKRNEYDGNTRLKGTDLFHVAKEDYNCNNLIPKLKDVAVQSQLIYYDEDTTDLSLMSTYIGECNIYDFVTRKTNEKPIISNEEIEQYRSKFNSLTDEQFGALQMLNKHEFSILAGSAGTGKTFTVNSLIQFCDEQGLSYTLLAPTGSAALRVHESTHRDAMTIHLKCLRDQDIHTDVLIVDECSMIDLKTFNMMINTISNDNIRVVLVGDKSQLTPVGIGCVFADLINSHKVPITELTKVFRYNDNGILYIATNTRQGRFCLDDNIVTHRKNSYSIGQMYHFYEMQNDDSVDESILERVNETYNKLLLKGVPKKDILILSAYNVGDCGVNKINSVIQAEVNPPSSQKKEFKKGRGVVFRVDDRVINTKNDYNAIPLDSYNQIEASNGVITGDDVPTTTLFNGQRGVVVEIRDKAMICDFEGEMIAIDRSKIQYIKLAYAITYHKSQGQEADYVISVVSPTQSRLLTRNLLYVGETRAKKAQYDIGTLDAMKQALSVDGIEIRDTWLNYLFQHNSIDNQ